MLAVVAALGLLLAACVDDATTSSDEADGAQAPEPAEEADAAEGANEQDVEQETDAGPLPVGAVNSPHSLASVTPGACAIDSPLPLPIEPACYSMAVPEDWQNPDAEDQVIIEVAVFEGDGSDESPIIYFDGGPGGHTLDNLFITFPLLVEPFLATRDFIVFDQRGLGLSQPALDCPELTEVALADLTGELDAESAAGAVLDARDSCRDRLVDSGVNLAAYNSIASANDVEAMRVLLGYEDLNVIGTSYGTRLGQTYLRMYPDAIRSLVLDSVFPTNYDLWSNFNQGAERAFDQLFDGCRDAPECAEEYPNFEDQLFELLDKLDAEPAEVELRDPFDGSTLDAVYDGDDLLGLVFSALYNRTQFSALPQLVENGLNGDFDDMATFGSIALASLESVSQGMRLSVECNEEIPFESVDELLSYEPSDPRYARFGGLEAGEQSLFSLCEDWPAGQAPDVEDEGVSSDVPTLVLAGQYDPITPPAGADIVRESLTNSYGVLFPSEGHALIVSSCGAEIVNSFIDDPTTEPATGCVVSSPAPAWSPEFDPAAIELVPFESTGLVEVSGLRPASWTDVGNGAFARQQTALDPTTLLVQPTNGLPGENLAELIATQLGTDFVAGDPVEVNGESWDLFVTPPLDSQAIRMAIGPGDDGIVVLLAAEPDEVDALFDVLFVPVAEAATVS